MHLITYNQSLKYHSRPHGLTAFRQTSLTGRRLALH